MEHSRNSAYVAREDHYQRSLCASICKAGEDQTAMEETARSLTGACASPIPARVEGRGPNHRRSSIESSGLPGSQLPSRSKTCRQTNMIGRIALVQQSLQ